MTHYPKSIRILIKNLSKLPGIGEKTAERLAMHLVNGSMQEVKQLAGSILEMKETIKLCQSCFGFSDDDLCMICSNPSRDKSLLCVVEQPADMASIEKSGAYNGIYFILGGVLSPMDGIGPDKIRINQLMDRLRRGGIKEIVLATGTGVEGESTAAFIAESLASVPVKVTRIASGVPIGGDLKYVDQVTLKKAMERRHGI